MNDVHFRMLITRLKSSSVKPSSLYAKGQACKELSDAGIFEGQTPEVRAQMKRMVERLLIQCERSGSWHGDRAVKLVSTALEKIVLFEEKLEADANRGLWPLEGPGTTFFECDWPSELLVSLAYPRSMDMKPEVSDEDIELIAEAHIAIGLAQSQAERIEVCNEWTKTHRRILPSDETVDEPLPGDPDYIPE